MKMPEPRRLCVHLSPKNHIRPTGSTKFATCSVTSRQTIPPNSQKHINSGPSISLHGSVSSRTASPPWAQRHRDPCGSAITLAGQVSGEEIQFRAMVGDKSVLGLKRFVSWFPDSKSFWMLLDEAPRLLKVLSEPQGITAFICSVILHAQACKRLLRSTSGWLLPQGSTSASGAATDFSWRHSSSSSCT